MNKHPHIKSLHQLFLTETQPFRKVHRLIDLFESILKTHTVYILAEYFAHNRISDSAKGLLATGLRTPSLGTWQLFARELFKELKHENHSWLITGFEREFEALDKALNSDTTNVIALRNGYAHGATPSDMQCESDIRQFEPFLNKLLQANWLQSTALVERNAEVFLCLENDAISLHPLLLYREEEGNAPFAFFNDLKNDKVGLLNYPLSKHYREKEFYREFHSILPLHEWKKTGNNEFLQRIEELTETFKGRTLERRQLLQFVANNHKGYFSIQGNPGIGKSALIAQFFKDLRSNNDLSDVLVVEYFIRRGTQQAQPDYLFNYLIKRTDELFPKGKEIRAEGKMTFDLQNQLFNKWRLWDEEGRGKLLFLIDGLDEGAENGLANYLPRENFNNILIIYGSRPGGHATLDKLWGELPVEHHQKLELGGLGKDDIRALIYEVANKYELERDSAWVDAVQQRSQGNPLYLKLLCDALENGSIALNDIGALPKEIDEYYKAILQRYAAELNDGDALLAALYAFAAAKDYLTFAHLGLINQLGDATVQRIGSTLKEVLYENPLTEEVLDYQLFHESFREYLVIEKQKEVNDAAERIVDFCANWRELEGNWEQRYALEHYAAHLADSKKEMRAHTLLQLLYDTPYANAQKKELKNFDASNRLYRTILLKASGMQRFEEQLEAALCLVDLKYEEANDAPQVIALVANGEIDLALKRIESFGGTDQEGVQRKFILYMLCLMELTLLDSKNKPFCKTAIERLLNHLDEHLPTDHSILNWNDFFSSYIIFQMACEWAALGLDFSILYKRTYFWETDWITGNAHYSDLHFKVLIDGAFNISDDHLKSCAMKAISTNLASQKKITEAIEITREISDEWEKSNALNFIASELAHQHKFIEALECARSIGDNWEKSSALMNISTELTKNGHNLEASSVMQESLECAREIIYERGKSQMLAEISTELAAQGKNCDAIMVIKENADFVKGISDDLDRDSALEAISIELAKQGKWSEATEFANKILGSRTKSSALKQISKLMRLKGELDKSKSTINSALECARTTIDVSGKINALLDISSELAKRDMVSESTSIIQEALDCAYSMQDAYSMCFALKDISNELYLQGKFNEAIECAKNIPDESEKSIALKNIVNELALKGMLDKAIECALSITDGSKSQAFKQISNVMGFQYRLNDAASVMKISLGSVRGMIDADKNKVLYETSTKLAKNGHFDKAIELSNNINDEFQQFRYLENISIWLAKHGEIEAAIKFVNLQEYDNSKSLLYISTALAREGKIKESSSLLHEASIKNYLDTDSRADTTAIIEISTELIRQTQLEVALEFANGILNDSNRIAALKAISTELDLQGNAIEAASVIHKAIDIAYGISNGGSFELIDISTKLTQQRNVNKALECARNISNEKYKNIALKDIGCELAKQGQLEASALVMQEAFNSAQNISDERDKNSALVDIAVELSKQGQLDESLAIARGISSDWQKSSALTAIAVELSKQGQLQESLDIARGISDETDMCKALKNIAVELRKQGQLEESTEVMQESFVIARGISNEFNKSDAMNGIAEELRKQGNFAMAEAAGQEILLVAQRQHAWKEMANTRIETDGWQKALERVGEFQSDEAKLFYLKGWSENVNVTDVDDACLKEALVKLVGDNASIEQLLQKYALRHVTIGKPSGELTARLNRTLNIQWALDIAAQFPKPEDASRLSTNLEHWLHEVEDEDDRDQIELWARQVAKGKITEAEFLQQVTALQ